MSIRHYRIVDQNSAQTAPQRADETASLRQSSSRKLAPMALQPLAICPTLLGEFDGITSRHQEHLPTAPILPGECHAALVCEYHFVLLHVVAVAN